MSFRGYKDFIKESSGEGFFKFTPEALNDLESESPLLSKMKDSFDGKPVTNSRVGEEIGEFWNGRIGFIKIPFSKSENDFTIDLVGGTTTPKSNLKNGLEATFKKFENAGEIELLPDYFTKSLRLSFEFDSQIKPGDLRMHDLYDWNDRHKMVFSYNAQTYPEIQSVIEKALELAIEKTRKVRIIVKPRLFAEKKDLNKILKKEFEKLYNELIDDFLKNGSLHPDDIDEDLFGLVLIKSTKDNPELIKLLNDLPDEAKKKWFRYASKIFKDEKIEFNAETISAIQKIYDLKSAWNLI